MTKINEKTMREQYDGQYSTFCKKNSDYGNSFEESLDKHGIVASIVRMGDKMNRLEALTDDSRTQQVGSESLLDTLEDLSNYAALTACWLKGVRAEDGEEEEVTHVYTFGQDEPYMTFKKPKKEIPDDDNVVDAMRYAAEDMMNDPIIRKRINEEIISYSLGAIIELMVDDIKRQRDPKVKLDERQIIVDQREKYYQKIARFIIGAPNIEFMDFVNCINTRSDLHSYERELLCEGVMDEIYSQIDKNPGGEEESEFRSKKFNIPTEEHKTENLTFKPQKEDEEEKEPLNEKMFKAILWLFHPIIDKNYRGGRDE